MSYTAADITELDDVQHTRLRPAVNLGLDVLNTALRELVDNAIEEVADPGNGGSTVTERYAGRDAYEAAAREAASKLVASRLLLSQDVGEVVDEALRAYDDAVERERHTGPR